MSHQTTALMQQAVIILPTICAACCVARPLTWPPAWRRELDEILFPAARRRSWRAVSAAASGHCRSSLQPRAVALGELPEGTQRRMAALGEADPVAAHTRLKAVLADVATARTKACKILLRARLGHVRTRPPSCTRVRSHCRSSAAGDTAKHAPVTAQSCATLDAFSQIEKVCASLG
jgi:hypothetical protein